MRGFRHQTEANFFLGLVSVKYLKCRFPRAPSHVLGTEQLPAPSHTSLQGPELFVDSVCLPDPLEPQSLHNSPQNEP